MSAIEGHRAAVENALNALGLRWDDWPGILTDDRLTSSDRLSGLLVLLESVESNVPITSYGFVVGEEDETLDMWGRQRQPWERLQRMTLPWTAPTATLAVESVTRALAYDDRAVALTLRGAKQVCEAGLADLELLDSLTACIARLDTLRNLESGVTEMSSLARRVVAAATPPELLDLSLLAGGDAWAAPARLAARAAPAQEVAALVRLLGELGPRKPSQRWQRGVDQALTPPASAQLLKQWLELAAFADIVPEWPDSEIGYCRGTLLVGTNTDLVRAAVFATGQLPEEDWPAALLGTLARRGSAHNGLAGHPEALSLRVAAAAVDTLIDRGGAADRRVLAELLEDLQRRDLVKRVGAALDRTDEAALRDADLRRTKAQEVRRKASPAPHQARAAMDSMLRKHFGAELRALGFKGGPRSWQRINSDRVDLIYVDAFVDVGTGQRRLTLDYGTRFAVAHPDEPWEPASQKIRHQHLDLTIAESAIDKDPFRETQLEAIALRIRQVVVPFLDTLGRYEFATDVLEHGIGVPPSAELIEGGMYSNDRGRVLALLARATRLD